MSPVDRPVRPEGDDTPPRFVAGQLVEWWDDFEQVWVPASIARLSTELPETTYFLRLQPSGARWAAAYELRAVPAAPETRPPAEAVPLLLARLLAAANAAEEHDLFGVAYDFRDLAAQLDTEPDGDLIDPAAIAAIADALAAARAATPAETTEH